MSVGGLGECDKEAKEAQKFLGENKLQVATLPSPRRLQDKKAVHASPLENQVALESHRPYSCTANELAFEWNQPHAL